MPRTRVAIAQFISHAEVEQNRAKMESLITRAADDNVKLIMFHELATTTYFCYDDERTEHFSLAEPLDGPTVSGIVEASKRTGVSVLLPTYEADGGRRYNTVVYIDPVAGIQGQYRKLHVPVTGDDSGQKGANEGFYFDAGDAPYSLPDPLAGMSIGTSVCYDRHFPEGGRLYALLGAHLIYVPTATYRDFIIDEIWKAELQAMAFQNSVYVAGVNKVGPVLGDNVAPGARYPGLSVIIDPKGRVIAELGGDEEIAFAEIDTEFCESTRAGAMRFLQARRPELYSLVAQNHPG